MIDRLRHLRKIENLFKENPKVAFTKTQIRDKFDIDHISVLNALTYLLDQDIIKLKRGKVKRYILIRGDKHD